MKSRGTGDLTGLRALVSQNLMFWQLPLGEPALLRAHEPGILYFTYVYVFPCKKYFFIKKSDSIATFIPGDFTDVDREAVEVPVMFENNVEVSTKYYLEKNTHFSLTKNKQKIKFKILQGPFHDGLLRRPRPGD